MYETFYRFSKNPFRLTPDPGFLFLSSVHRQALAHLTYGVENQHGFILITGPVGSGKTTLLRSLMAAMPAETRQAFIADPSGSFPELLRMILHELTGEEVSPDLPRDALLLKLRVLLESEEVSAGGPGLILIDEAQNMQPDVLEELRMLSNIETNESKLLQIVLAGQPELLETLARADMRQLWQRIVIRYQLEPLGRRETGQYVAHRLGCVSQNGRLIFSRGAISEIYRFARGIPRLINVACEAALMAGFADEERQINHKLVRSTLEELALVDESGKCPTVGHVPKRPRSRARWLPRLALFAALLAVAGACAYFFIPGAPEWLADQWARVRSMMAS